MQVVPVKFGTKGADTDTVISAGDAQVLEKSFDFLVRYLGQITSIELNDILSAGMGVQLVTYAHKPGWIPTAGMGESDGATDVLRLQALGIPKGMLVFIDLEGSAGSSQATTDWVNARAFALVAAGYEAGLYVGDGCVLNAEELYALPNITRYWRGYNEGIPEPKCGWAQMQLFPPNQIVAGIKVDIDYSTSDYHARVPLMLTT